MKRFVAIAALTMFAAADLGGTAMAAPVAGAAIAASHDALVLVKNGKKGGGKSGRHGKTGKGGHGGKTGHRSSHKKK